MKENELERKVDLLDREVALLAERTEKTEKELSKRLDDLEFKMKVLELYVATVHPNNGGTTYAIQSKIFDMRPAA